MITAMKHIYQGVVKPQLYGRVSDTTTWNTIDYRTLNVGKTYEVSRGVFEAIKSIVQGEVLMPDGTTNRSVLKDWAIADYVDTTNKPPEIVWWNNARTLIRSYDDLGSSFKRMRLAYVSSDECGDIPELKLFVNGTLLPRVLFWKGSIDLLGTHQPRGIEYFELVEEAEEDIRQNGDASDYYVQHGAVYDNPFMDPEQIRKIENIADERLRQQIIYGKYVDAKDHFFTWDECNQIFNDDIPYDAESGFSIKPEEINPNGSYVFIVDLAATEDETAATVIEHNRFVFNWERKRFELPYKIVFHKAFKGEKIPITMQYELIRSWYKIFKDKARNTAFIFDEGSLGGKNAADAFRDLYGHGFPGPKKSYAQEKAYAVGSLKEVVGRGRKVVLGADGKKIDLVKNWGWLKASSKLRELRRQFEVYALDDKKLRQDRISTIYMGIHWIEKRRPMSTHNKAVDLDMYRSTIPRGVNYGN